MSKQNLAMRKNCLFAAVGATALMLASCSADESVALNTLDGAINYTVVADNQTRAANSYSSNNPPEKFYVWADNHPGIKGNPITKQADGSYTDAKTQYWPNDGKQTLSFYAVADGDFALDAKGKVEASILRESGMVVVENYQIKEKINEQLDLMYAVAKDVNKGDVVSLNFRHALSQICFKAQSEIPNVTITIEKITIGNLQNEGTFTLPTTSTTGTVNDHSTSLTSSSISEGGGWSDKGGNASYSIEFTSDNVLEADTNKKELTLTGNDTKDHKLPTNSNGEKWYANALNLLPQEKAITGNGNEDPYFELKLSVTRKGTNGAEDDVLEKNTPHKIPINIKWEKGIRYIYTFKFTQEWLDDKIKPIKYIVTTDDFKEDDTHFVIDEHEAILMRKADGTTPALYFATTNIGAMTPSDCGKYFWWGDIEGHEVENEKIRDGFEFANNNDKILTLHKKKSDLSGWLDNQDNLVSGRDAAAELWEGSWRMPTKEDFNWLKNESNCTWTWIDSAPIGYKVVSNSTGGTIFLPAAGFIGQDYPNFGSTAQLTFGEICYYWSSTFPDDENNTNTAFRLKATTSNSLVVSPQGNRFDGFPIRPVTNGKQEEGSN